MGYLQRKKGEPEPALQGEKPTNAAGGNSALLAKRVDQISSWVLTPVNNSENRVELLNVFELKCETLREPLEIVVVHFLSLRKNLKLWLKPAKIAGC